ncbi:MAG: hypothetical protein KGI97_00045 [Alphaproteobacteria bacterium]|nr:hypothetical protein [Alphaproteobacteria bacterium]
MTRKTKARLAGAMLTVGFHAAREPLIWRFDLERNHSFTLALQGEDGDWELGVTSPKGDFYPITHFAAREDAEEAFLAVEKALARRKSFFGAIGKAVLVLLVLALVVAAAVVGFGLYVGGPDSTPIAGVTSASPQLPEGVPLPANQVLQPPSQQ